MNTKPLPKGAVALSAIALALLGGCGKSDGTTAKSTNQEPSALTAPVDYLGAVGKAKIAAEKTVDIASITRAIQMFQVDEGRNPKDLNELVEGKFLPRLPEAPYGMQLKYDAASGKVSVVPSPQTK